MTILYNAGDGLHGDAILVIARKITKPKTIPGSGRHRRQQVKAIEDAICYIDKELRFLPKD